MILSMLDNKEVCVSFEQNSFHSILCTGITFATFSMDGNTPDETDRSNMSAR